MTYWKNTFRPLQYEEVLGGNAYTNCQVLSMRTLLALKPYSTRRWKASSYLAFNPSTRIHTNSFRIVKRNAELFKFSSPENPSQVFFLLKTKPIEEFFICSLIYWIIFSSLSRPVALLQESLILQCFSYHQRNIRSKAAVEYYYEMFFFSCV